MPNVLWCHTCEQHILAKGSECPTCLAGSEVKAPALAVLGESERTDGAHEGIWVQPRSDGTAWIYDAAGALVTVSATPYHPNEASCPKGHKYLVVGQAPCPVCEPIRPHRRESRSGARRRIFAWSGFGIGALAVSTIVLLATGVLVDQRHNDTAPPTSTVDTTTTPDAPKSTTPKPDVPSTTTTIAPNPAEAASVLADTDLAAYDFLDAAVGLIAFPIEEANAGWEERTMPFSEAEKRFEEATLLTRDLARYVTTDRTLRSEPNLFAEVTKLADNVAALPDAFREPDLGEERRSTISAIRSSYIAIASLSDQQRAEGSKSCSFPLVTAALYVAFLVDDATDDEFNRWNEGSPPLRDLGDLEDGLSAAESLLWLLRDDDLNVDTSATVEATYFITIANQDLVSGIRADNFEMVSEGIDDWNTASAALPDDLPDEYCSSGDFGL